MAKKITKARTAAQKRRDKRRISLAGGESVPGRPAGRDRRHTNQRAENPMQTVLNARARRAGCDIRKAHDTLFGTEIGMCIAAMIPASQERSALESTYRHISAAKHNWNQRIISANPNPQAAALPMLPEPMQTDPGHSVDLRDSDERDEAARRSWLSWLDDMMRLPADQRHALRGHIDGYGAQLWHEIDARPTRTGALAVKALSSLHDMRAG